MPEGIPLNTTPISLEKIPEIIDQANKEQWERLALIGPSWDLERAGALLSAFEEAPNSVFFLDSCLTDDTLGFLGSLPHIEVLMLPDNKIGDEGARALSSLINLTVLFLDNNDIGDEGARALSSLTSLAGLDLSSNDIGDEGVRALSSLTNLTGLFLSSNKIGDEGARALSSLTNLTDLFLDNNKIGDEGARALSSLTNLTRLDLSKNDIGDEGARALSSLTSLAGLFLGSNKIGDEGAIAFSSLTNLTTLDLNNNDIGDEGVRALSSLTNLTDLFLDNNDIGDEGARALSSLTNLTRLFLPNNKIGDEGARALSSLTNLTRLFLSRNDIGDEGVRAFFCLKNLTTLFLGGNNIGDEGVRALSSLTNLTRLDLISNDIGDEGARALSSLTNLTDLFLGGNKIGDEGARALSSLTNLTTLNLGWNDIGDEGARALSSLTNLTVLFLSNNDIGDEGARALSSLTNLTDLFLSNNKIGDEGICFLMDVWLLEPMDKLTILDLRGNANLSELLPREIIDSCDAQRILTAYKRFKQSRDSNGLQPLNEVKLLVVGDEAVGKTSLIRYLVENKPRDEDEKKTVGAAIHEHVETKHWPLENSDTRVNVWDFGGQRILQGTHRFFLTQRSLYILVLEARREDEQHRRIDEWLSMVQSNGGDSPIILVINKCDMGNPRFLNLDEAWLRDEYPIIDFVYTQCNDDAPSRDSIAKLRRVIVDAIEKKECLKHVRDPIPQVWLEIKNEVEELAKKQPILRMEDFKRICHSSGRNLSPEEEETLLHLLHDLGSVVAHGVKRKEAAFREITLLDPNWLTTAIYTILTHHELRDQEGELTATQLGTWLDASLYPNNTHEFILKMMQDEDVSLMFAYKERGRYLVPEALPKRAPTYDNIWPEDESVFFRFEYKYLPPNLLPRLIVRTHHYGKDTCWYSGVVLEKDGCPILIEANLLKRQVNLKVAGPEHKRRRVLDVIRHDMDAVHQFYEELDVTERVPLPDKPDVSVSYNHLEVLEQRHGQDYKHFPENAEREYTVQELLSGVRKYPKRQEEMETELRDKYVINQIIGNQGSIHVGDMGAHSSANANNQIEIGDHKPDEKEESVKKSFLSQVDSWAYVSAASGLLAVAAIILLYYLPQAWKLPVGLLLGVFLGVAGFVSSLNPKYFYRRWLAFLLFKGLLIKAAWPQIKFVFKLLGIPISDSVNWGYWIAWGVAVVVLAVLDYKRTDARNHT